MFKFQGGFEPVRILTFPMCTVLTIQYNMDLGAFTNVHSRLPSAVVKRICEDLRSGRQFVTSPSDRNQPSGKLPNIRRGRPWYPSMNSIAARSEKWRGLVRLSAKSSPDRNVLSGIYKLEANCTFAEQVGMQTERHKVKTSQPRFVFSKNPPKNFLHDIPTAALIVLAASQRWQRSQDCDTWKVLSHGFNKSSERIRHLERSSRGYMVVEVCFSPS